MQNMVRNFANTRPQKSNRAVLSGKFDFIKGLKEGSPSDQFQTKLKELYQVLVSTHNDKN